MLGEISGCEGVEHNVSEKILRRTGGLDGGCRGGCMLSCLFMSFFPWLACGESFRPWLRPQVPETGW